MEKFRVMAKTWENLECLPKWKLMLQVFQNNCASIRAKNSGPGSTQRQ